MLEEAKCGRGWSRESALGVGVQYGCRVQEEGTCMRRE